MANTFSAVQFSGIIVEPWRHSIKEYWLMSEVWLWCFGLLEKNKESDQRVG